MKKLKILWSLLALPLIAVSCSDKDVLNSGSGNEKIPEGEGVYMTVNFTPFNKSTRSYTDGDNTSNDGTEVGTDAENKINRVLLVLADKDNNYIAHAEVNTEKNLTASSDGTIYQAKAKFSKTAISEYYDDLTIEEGVNPSVKVFIYCNAPAALTEEFKKIDLGESTETWYNITAKLTGTDAINIWGDNSFVMTNVSTATRYFPASFDTWNLFSTENNPFDLSGMNNQNTSQEVNNGNTNTSINGGSINVHRMAARFDFRDGSQWLIGEGNDAKPIGNGIKGEAFTYSLMENADGKTLVKAKLINMSLVNVLNEEYYLGRVSTEDKNWSTNYTLLGAEKPWFSYEDGTAVPKSGNYVVTPKSSERGTALTNDFSKYYQYPFFDANGIVASRGSGWYTSSMESVIAKPTDNYGGNYHVWRYVSENTMAGGSEGQVNSSSTGVVFKAQLLSGDALNSDDASYWDKELAKALDNTSSNGPVLYSFSGNLYCSWKHIQYAALKSAGYDETKGDDQELDKSATLFKAVFGDGGTGEITFNLNDGTEKTYAEHTVGEDGNPTATLMPQDQTSPNYLHSKLPNHDGNNPNTTGTEWNNFRDAVVNATFTIYQKYGETINGTTTWGYFCYYYYWNRHNDNGKDGIMGEMEFAVVRNNVYKLAVTSLKTLGHPRIPENDPDSPKPDTPDEKSDLYMTVSVQVVPWVVRINNIEF